MREHINKTLESIKEHTKEDHEYVKRYGASEIIHQTFTIPYSQATTSDQGFSFKLDNLTTESGKTVYNILQDKFHDMAMGLEKQIKQKNEALELFKKIAEDNDDDIIKSQIQMIEADIAQLSHNLISLRGEADYINVEHDISHIIGNLKEKILCECCGDLKKNENK